MQLLTLISLDFFSGSFWGGEEGKITPCLKLLRIMLETWNLLGKYTHIFKFRKYTFYYQDPHDFPDVSIFSQKISISWQK